MADVGVDVAAAVDVASVDVDSVASVGSVRCVWFFFQT